jgi:exodeoxyribonuclease-5
MTNWSPQQDNALRAVGRWLRAKPGRGAPQIFRLFGYAGTGKTTLARHLAMDVDPVFFGSYTGKAAHVLRRKGCTGAQTIHSMIYRLQRADETTGEPQFVLDECAPARHAGLIVIDEVSMVDEELARDLMSFGRPILVLGDPAQLPPVKGHGFFIAAPPDVLLTEVHRQARESAIIRLATDIREERPIARQGSADATVIGRREVTDLMRLSADQILVGRNVTPARHQRRHAPTDEPHGASPATRRAPGLPAQRQEEEILQWIDLDRRRCAAHGLPLLERLQHLARP